MTARAATTFAFSLVKLPAVATMTMYDVLEGQLKLCLCHNENMGLRSETGCPLDTVQEVISIISQAIPMVSGIYQRP